MRVRNMIVSWRDKEPTERQIRLVQEMKDLVYGIGSPEKETRGSYCDFISRNMKRYKEAGSDLNDIILENYIDVTDY